MICGLSIGEKFSLGGITTLLGLGMTFLVLAILIGVVILVNFIIKNVGKISLKKEKSYLNEIISQEQSESIKEKNDKDIAPETLLAIESAVKTFVREEDDVPHENVKIISVTKK